MIIKTSLFDEVNAKTHHSPRLWTNPNLQDSLDAKAQRLINILLHGTVIPIYRHCHASETYALLRGKIPVVFYNDLGEQTKRHLIDPNIGNYGVHITPGQWYGIEVVAPSAILEVKDGSIYPLAPEDVPERLPIFTYR